MKKFLIIALAAASLSLGACQTTIDPTNLLTTSVKNPIGLKQLDVVQNSYGAALSVAVSYGRACKAKIINKNCWNVIEELQPYQKKAQISVVTLRNFVKKNPTVDATGLYNTAMQTIAEFKAAQQTNGVK